KNIMTAIDLANERVSGFCGLDFDFTKNVEFQGIDGQMGSLAAKIAHAEDHIDKTDRIVAATLDSIDAAAECVTAAASASADFTGVSRGIALAACSINTAATALAHTTATIEIEKRKKTIREDHK